MDKEKCQVSERKVLYKPKVRIQKENVSTIFFLNEKESHLKINSFDTRTYLILENIL